MIHPIPFYILAALTVAGALSVVLARQPIYAVLSLVVALFGLSGLFLLLEAYFVAMVQILVYAGAILVLFLFVVMLLEVNPLPPSHAGKKWLKGAGVCCGLFFLFEIAFAARAFIALKASSLAGTTYAIGKALFTTYALPFEVASFLLLVGIIGAVVLAKKNP